MTARTPPSWLQNGSHKAENDRLMTEALVMSEGVVGDTHLQVTHSSGMTVSVAGGGAFIDGTENTYQGMYHAYNAGATSLTLDAADATNPRVDIIVARIRDAAYSGATNSFAIEVVKGTAAASPTTPATPDNSLCLATVIVAAGATTVAGAIGDTRYLAAPRTPVFGGGRYPLDTVGAVGYRNSNGKTEGLEIYNGANWRPPWNVAWGEVAVGTMTADSGTLLTSSASPTALITVTFTAVANRNYAIDTFASFQSTVADDGVQMQLRQTSSTGTVLQQGFHVFPVASYRGSISMPYRSTFSATNITVVLCANRYVGSGNALLKADATCPAYVLVRDVGPSGAPT